jgi:hypothetical protein
MGKDVQYLDTDAEKSEWKECYDLACKFLKNHVEIEKKIASVHARFIDPRKPAKVGWYSVKVPDGFVEIVKPDGSVEKTKQRKYKEVRRAEYHERKKIFKSEPVCAAICNKLAIEEKIKEWELWYKAIEQTELTMRGELFERIVLKTWRVPETKNEDKEGICYRLFGRTWAKSTMEKRFVIIANRCASFAMMLGAPVK